MLTADLATLNTLINDKISEIKRHRGEIDEINQAFNAIVNVFCAQKDELFKF